MAVNHRDDLVQELYARSLDRATRAAFAASLAAFAVYAAGLLPPFVPFDALAALWHLPVHEYLARTGAPTRWEWLRLVGFSDYLILACLALIAIVTLVCYLAVLPVLLRLGERLQATLAAAQLLVRLIAASGLLAGG